MKELIAKKYVKALVESFDLKEISELLGFLRNIDQAFQNESFREIIATPSIDKAKKTALVLSVFGSDSPKFVNFIKLLGEKGRFEIVSNICEELEKTIANMKNEYRGVLASKDPFDNKMLKKLENAFAKKLNVRLVLTQEVLPKEGVKLVVEDLGVEVSFSREKFINDLKEHILRAF